MMSRSFVTDDRTSIDVAVEFGIKNKLMEKCYQHGGEHYHFEDADVPKMINMAIKEGLLKLHLELGEWYYHPTQKGLNFLDSRHEQQDSEVVSQ